MPPEVIWSTRRLLSQLRNILGSDIGGLAAEARGNEVGHGGDLDVGIPASEGWHRHKAVRGRPGRARDDDLSNIGGGAIINGTGTGNRRVGELLTQSPRRHELAVSAGW